MRTPLEVGPVMPSVLCPCGQRVTTTPTNVGRKGVCPKCRSRVSFPPPEYASTKDFETATRRPPFPALDGTDLEMETTQEVQPAPTPCSRETSHVPPPETERVEPWFYRAAEVSARTSLVLGVTQFPLVVGWAGAGAARVLPDPVLGLSSGGSLPRMPGDPPPRRHRPQRAAPSP